MPIRLFIATAIHKVQYYNRAPKSNKLIHVDAPNQLIPLNPEPSLRRFCKTARRHTHSNLADIFLISSQSAAR